MQNTVSSGTAEPGDLATGSICGFAGATLVLTAAGAVPVDCLGTGDRIVTRDAGRVRLSGVRSERLDGLRSVVITCRSPDTHQPQWRDLTVGADQQILLRDWRARALSRSGCAVVPVKRLIDGRLIRFAPRDTRPRLFTLIFDTRHVIYAHGMEWATA